MRITLINGVPDDTFTAYEKAIDRSVENMRRRHDVDYFVVREMDIGHCVGCFGCWMKTPGRCAIHDDMETILGSMAKTDFILYISPVSAGFVTREIKTVLDRSIPIVLPYIEIYNGECHHPKRYGNTANMGIILLDDGSLDPEAVNIVYEAFDRNGLNFHNDKILKRTANPDEMEGVFDEIDRY